MLSGLSELLSYLIRWVPRVRLCRRTHAVVLFGRRGQVSLGKPGLYWLCPLTTEAELVPLTRQSVDVPGSTLTSSDGVTVAVAATVVVRIADPAVALTTCESWSVVAVEMVQAALCQAVCARSWKALRGELGAEVRQEVLRVARRLLRPYGVRLEDVWMTDCARATVVRHLGAGVLAPAPAEND